MTKQSPSNMAGDWSNRPSLLSMTQLANRTKRILLAAILLSIVLLLACSQQEKAPGTASKERFPDSILEKATIKMTSSGIKQAVIYADTLFVFQKEDSVSARNVKVDFYDETGAYQSTLTAKMGLVRQKQQTFSVWGNVVAQNDTSKLETESLHWNSKLNLITTDDFVRFQRNGDVITGYGLEADNKLQNVRILHNVKGSIKEVPKSEQELDSLEKTKGEGAPP